MITLQSLTVAILSIASTAAATDHWDALLHRHTCNGHCAARQPWHGTGNSSARGGEQNLSISGFDQNFDFAQSTNDDAAQQDDSSHLFLAIHSLHGDQAVSGLTRSVKIEYSPLTFEMHSTNQAMPSEFRLLIDGIAAHPEHFRQSSDWLQTEQSWSRNVEWNCPPLGHHTIQFQVSLNDRLVASEPLWIEIVAPAKPEAIAVGSNALGTTPIKTGEIVSVYRDTMVVRFAMSPATEMLMHVQGFENVKAQLVDDCIFEFKLKNFSVGRNAIRFSRMVGTDCAMTSEMSDTLWIQYEPLHALHSLRNENAARRKAVVDQIRNISMNTRPGFDTLAIHTQVNSKYSELNFDHVLQHHPDASPAGHTPTTSTSGKTDAHEVMGAVGSLPPKNTSVSSEDITQEHLPELSSANQTAPAIETPIPAPVLPANEGNPTTNDSNGGTRQMSKPIIPDPAHSRNRIPTNTRFVNHNSHTPSDPVSTISAATSEPICLVECQPSDILLETAQKTACQLSKFEDNFAFSESVFQVNKVVSHVIFDAPAYFTQNGYGSAGQEDARNGLVLLEGMELSTQASGHWELKIPYIKSTTPAVLHLQIQFKTDTGEWKPLTLQPLCFKAGRPCIDPTDCLCESTGSAGANSTNQKARCDCSDVHQPTVTLTGYSPLLRREVGFFTDVRRRGSVVFGHGYSALEDRRSF